MTLDTQIKKLIQAHSDRISKTNPLFTQARAGTLSKAKVARYSYNLMRASKENYQRIVKAEEAAQSRGMSDFADFMSEKRVEEVDHDQWAKSDLQAQGFNQPDQDPAFDVVPSFAPLYSHLDQVIERDPRLFLAFMTFTEYFTVIEGPALLSSLESKCDTPSTKMTSIGYHAVLDREHVEEDLGAIARYADNFDLRSAIFEEIDASANYIDRILSECVR